MQVICVNRERLIQVCFEYVSLIASRVDGVARVRVHERLSEITGIDYDELRKYLWNLDRYGYRVELEDMPPSEEKRKALLDIANRLADELLKVIENRLWDFFRQNKELMGDLERYGYDDERWISEWRENGYWLCNGEPILEPLVE